MSHRVIEVSDGGFEYHRESLLPHDAPASVLEAWPPIVTVPYRPLIVDVDATLMLLDTGAGRLGPGTGRLHDSLIAQSIAPEQIGLVLLSHAHADHIGGLLDESGRPAFPNARIVIARQEFEFWHNSGIRDRLGSGSVYGNAMIESVILEWFDRYVVPLKDRLELVESDAEVMPGVRMLPAPGHTPGHCAVLINGAGDPVLFTADAFALPDHITHPEWTSSFDLDAEQTVRTRRRLLDLAAAENCRVVHYHVDGIGHVVRRGSAFAWEPEPASAVLSEIR
jgi:glyoxylase-like metal-dependent hydrolase (beta-lactamase superfamily II)